MSKGFHFFRDTIRLLLATIHGGSILGLATYFHPFSRFEVQYVAICIGSMLWFLGKCL